MKSYSPTEISELLSPATINLDLKSADRETVLGELVHQIPQLASQPEARPTLLRALHEREQLYSTGIGDGVALPHARNALVGLVEKPIHRVWAPCRGHPLWRSRCQPAKVFFLPIAPTVTQHLGILARLSRLLRDPRLRQSLLAADQPEKVIELIRKAESSRTRSPGLYGLQGGNREIRGRSLGPEPPHNSRLRSQRFSGHSVPVKRDRHVLVPPNASLIASRSFSQCSSVFHE